MGDVKGLQFYGTAVAICIICSICMTQQQRCRALISLLMPDASSLGAVVDA
jgi:hypothetical protein